MTSKTNGTVEIHGRQYQTVAYRVQQFREKCPSHTLNTSIERLDEDMVVMRAEILDETGRLIATGHAQEFRQSSTINRTSYVENCETSAIGRALATFGLGGTEFATADELNNAINNKKPPHAAERPGDGNGKITPSTGMLESLDIDAQNYCMDVAHRVERLAQKSDVQGATDEWESEAAHLEKISEFAKGAAWALIDSKARSAIKAEQVRRRPELKKEAA